MQPFVAACLDLLDESLTGPADPKRTWVVSNEPASGLIGTLDALSAEQASRAPTPGARSAAAHAEHERFALDLARRRLEGEDPAAATAADWDASWGTGTVTEPMWANLRAELRRAGIELRQTIESKQSWSGTDVKGLAATLGHLTYHLGAIRHIVKTLRAGAPDAPRCG
jgi:hypothetical protein